MLRNFPARTVDWIMGAITSLLLGSILNAFTAASGYWIVIITILSACLIWAVSARIRESENDRKRAKTNIVQEELLRLDSMNESSDWDSWLVETRAFLRGLGERQKAKALDESVGKVAPSQRAKAARAFIKGMFGESNII